MLALVGTRRSTTFSNSSLNTNSFCCTQQIHLLQTTHSWNSFCGQAHEFITFVQTPYLLIATRSATSPLFKQIVESKLSPQGYYSLIEFICSLRLQFISFAQTVLLIATRSATSPLFKQIVESKLSPQETSLLMNEFIGARTNSFDSFKQMGRKSSFVARNNSLVTRWTQGTPGSWTSSTLSFHSLKQSSRGLRLSPQGYYSLVALVQTVGTI